MSLDQGATPSANPPEGFEPFPFADGFADHVGPMFIKRHEGKGIMGFRVLPHHCNPAGICHGGMMMTLMDMAIGVNVAMDADSGTFLPTVNLSYDFIAPGKKGDWLQSNIDWVKTTRRTGFASGFLVGSDGPVLRANGIVKITKADDARFQMQSGKAFEFGGKLGE